MQTSSEIIPLFSSPVYCAVDDTLPDVISKVEDLEYQSYSKNYNGGSQSVNQNVIADLPEVMHFLEPHVKEYIYGTMGIDEKYIIDIPCSWINCHQHLESAHEHAHRNSMYSGIVYLKTHPNCGDLVFTNYKYHTLDPDRVSYNVFNSPRWTLQPVDGMVVIFPSELVHSVQPNQDTNRRYSLAFNLMIRGEYGHATSYLTL